ncbi:hypothetical protein D3C71_1892390 [compost metagenome]
MTQDNTWNGFDFAIQHRGTLSISEATYLSLSKQNVITLTISQFIHALLDFRRCQAVVSAIPTIELSR